MVLKNYYTILGIHPNSNFKEIKSAYRLLAKKYHPDKNNGSIENEHLFKELQEAYSILSNPGKKRVYDSKLGFQPTTTQKHTYTAYHGNAYRYAQENAPKPFNESKPANIKESGGSEFIQLTVSFGIALVLLYLIIYFASLNSVKKDEQKIPYHTSEIAK